jgi:addiction module HigA family antidote
MTPPEEAMTPHPGTYLQSVLTELGWRQTDLAHRTGRQRSDISRVLACKAPIGPRLALDLERALDHRVTAETWCRLQADHDVAQARLREYVAAHKVPGPPTVKVWR